MNLAILYLWSVSVCFFAAGLGFNHAARPFEQAAPAASRPPLDALLPVQEVAVDVPAKPVYRGENGEVYFKSDAPLEIIEARSKSLRGLIDPANQTFVWAVEISSFDGFNSPLQREHFNENYLESNRFPRAIFSGKVIEKVDFSKDGTYSVRAKGKLQIHGAEQERIIKGSLERRGNTLRIEASFTVPLNDHNISIPKIVHQKIAEEISVTIKAVLTAQE